MVESVNLRCSCPDNFPCDPRDQELALCANPNQSRPRTSNYGIRSVATLPQEWVTPFPAAFLYKSLSYTSPTCAESPSRQAPATDTKVRTRHQMDAVHPSQSILLVTAKMGQFLLE